MQYKRDGASKALINTDSNLIQARRKEKRQAEKIIELQEEIASVKNELHEIKDLLHQIFTKG